jgi:hypothetical protein
MKGVVVPSIFELLPDAATDLEMEVWRHRHISGVEQAMDVATQQETVSRLMVAAVAVGTDMGSF